MNNDIYSDAIIKEAREAFGAGRLDAHDCRVTVDNPLCGDRITLEAKGDGQQIAEAAHKTRGCLLTRATMSILARHLTTSSRHDLALMRSQIETLLKGEAPVALWPEFAMLKPVADVKSRHDCVLLAFDAVEAAYGALKDAKN